MDPYIDNLETLAYGPFAVDQIQSLVVPLDPDLAPALQIAAARLTFATEAMRSTLARAGEIDVVTYKTAEGAPDPIAAGRAVLRRFISYAESREGGEGIVRDALAGEALGTVVRSRPARSEGALSGAASLPARSSAALRVAQSAMTCPSPAASATSGERVVA